MPKKLSRSSATCISRKKKVSAMSVSPYLMIPSRRGSYFFLAKQENSRPKNGLGNQERDKPCDGERNRDGKSYVCVRKREERKAALARFTRESSGSFLFIICPRYTHRWKEEKMRRWGKMGRLGTSWLKKQNEKGRDGKNLWKNFGIIPWNVNFSAASHKIGC